MTVVVRAARPADAAVLAAVSRAAIEESAAGHYTPAQLAVWAARRSEAAHARFVETTTVLVAEVDGVVAGFASVAPAAVDGLVPGEVDQLFVAPSAGGRGVARALLTAVEAAARAAGLPALVTHASWRAAPVFERLGYRRVEVESVTLDGETLTRARMVKELD
ncbi:GNAT family N-acetyltransferase [Geodermatophilus sp. CPCC 205761]|uniref:GNAT family N-acetyltransferase n=1 Tax=Geodermatophilus sp. CPCC 205761 TaxID=2936597 RepID=UPI003EF04505